MELEYIMLSEICHAEKELYDLTHMWNLRNKTEDHREQVGKIKQGKIREGDKPQRLLIIGNELRVAEGEGWGNWVMDIKEGT